MQNICSFLILLLSAFSMAQIPNGNFENWSTINGYQSPYSWDNLNTITFNQNIFTCYKGAPGQSGNSYLAVITRSVSGKGIVPGRVVSGKIDTVTYNPISGFPFVQRPQNLNYYLQYMPYDPSDTCSVKVILTKWNSSLLRRDTIAKGLNNYNVMAHSWLFNSVYLNYHSGDAPDSAMIIISSSGVNAKNGSYIYLDNMSFSGNVVGIEELELRSKIKIYPNPSKNYFTIELKEMPANSNYSIEVKDLKGTTFKKLDISKEFNLIDVTNIPEGSYIIQIQTEKTRLNKKIVIVR